MTDRDVACICGHRFYDHDRAILPEQPCEIAGCSCSGFDISSEDQADRDADRLIHRCCCNDGFRCRCPEQYRPTVAAELRKRDERITELELTLAAEQGRPEGALPGWLPNGRFMWVPRDSERLLKLERERCDWTLYRFKEGKETHRSYHPTARAAMKAAEEDDR